MSSKFQTDHLLSMDAAPSEDPRAALEALLAVELGGDNAEALVTRMLALMGTDASTIGAMMRPSSYYSPPNDYHARGKSLHQSCIVGTTAVVRIRLEDGADPNERDQAGRTPLLLAAKNRHLDIVKLLVANGATKKIPRRIPAQDGSTAETYSYACSDLEAVVTAWGFDEIGDWLRDIQIKDGKFILWTPLCEVRLLTAPMVRNMLRAGALPAGWLQDAARAECEALAREEERDGVPAAKRVGELVVLASRGWSPRSNELWPASVRARARELLIAGALVSRELVPKHAHAMLDVWIAEVMPRAWGPNFLVREIVRKEVLPYSRATYRAEF